MSGAGENVVTWEATDRGARCAMGCSIMVLLLVGAAMLVVYILYRLFGLVVATLRFLLGDDVLQGRAQVTSPVFVVSNRGMGAEVAHLLAEQGHAVTLLESGADPAPLLPAGPRAFLLERLEELRVTVRTGHRVLGLDAEGILIEADGRETRVDDPGTVVLALGRRGNDDLASALEGARVSMTVIGDAERPRHAQAAIHEGALAGRDI